MTGCQEGEVPCKLKSWETIQKSEIKFIAHASHMWADASFERGSLEGKVL